uniref:Uncharacterized protein n=2 Tax=Triticum urartu TaxID=4572 RepID=A0A8R7UBG0_TRIUA
RRASRVDVLRLLRPNGEHHLGGPLKVDCVLGAPGLRRLAWSTTPTGYQPDFALPDEVLYQAGLLAGGFEDGTVRIWDPKPALRWDLGEGVPEKPKAVWRLDDDPKNALTLEAQIPATVADMHAKVREMKWASYYDHDSRGMNRAGVGVKTGGSWVGGPELCV